jgi:hypothetical protein
MRLISLLVGLGVLGYVIYIYLHSGSVSSVSETEQQATPQQTIERAQQTADQAQQMLERQQQLRDNPDQQ